MAEYFFCPESIIRSQNESYYKGKQFASANRQNAGMGLWNALVEEQFPIYFVSSSSNSR